jgi:hypothetical protein
MTDSTLETIVFDIAREMYREATPPLDFDAVLDDPDAYDPELHLQHELASDRQQAIVQKHIERHDLTDREASVVSTTAILQYGPTTPRD